MDPQQQSIADEFDQYKETYDSAVNHALAFSGQTVDAFTKAKAEDLLRKISSCFCNPNVVSVLDVGCGIGNYHPFLTPLVGSVSGVDVSSACVEKARERNPSVSYSVYDGDLLPYSDHQFDVTFCVCVLHHVPPAKWMNFIAELGRVTRRGGIIVIYEHNPRHPLTMKVVNSCAFDRDAVLLSKAQTRHLLEQGGCSNVSTISVLTLPPAGPLLKRLDRFFEKLPFGTQYRTVGYVE